MSKPRRPSEKDLRKQVVETSLAMSRSGLSPGRSGNVSCRFGEGMLITPSGKLYAKLDPEDVVFVRKDGEVSRQHGVPSSEWHLHLRAYEQRPDRHAIVHAHSIYATVLACARKTIPAFHYMVAVAGGKDIPCVPYATFGTDELACHVASGLVARDACLMSNHGQVSLGTTPARALELAQEVEVLAEEYYKVLVLGAPHLLGDAEMAVVLEKFKNYGHNALRQRKT